jgi:DNA-binding transcriptional ArsR family regulator
MNILSEVVITPFLGSYMLLRISRELTSEEVFEKIGAFEKQFGMSFEEFEELSRKRKMSAGSVRAYSEWAELVDSYKGYVEDGELDYTAEEVRDFKPEQTALLSQKRIELLCQLAALRVESINDLAQKVKRNVKNVYEDLKVLNEFGFVKLNRRKKRALVPETLVKEITFIIR